MANVANNGRIGTPRSGSFSSDCVPFKRPTIKTDGRFFRGELKANGRRAAVEMKENYLLTHDVDAGYTIDEILTKIPDELFCISWTTHSHLKTTTKLSKAGLRIHMESQGRTGEPTAEDARDFLLWKDATPRCLSEPRTISTRTGDCTVTHAPWPRVRIAFLLAKPFAFPDKAARELWSRKYLAFADEIGLAVDECCKDPSRLFYLPCVPKGAKFERDEHEIVIFSGAPLDLDAVKVPPAPEPRKKERQPGSTTASGSAAQPGGFETPHLARFLATCADSFLAADWISSIAPGEIRRKLEGGEVDATCPLTGGHDPKNLCFHVMNAKPGDSFNIWCLHDDCKRLSAKPNGKQDRGRYLDALCVKHGIASATELVEWCDEATQVAWAPDRMAVYEEIDELPAEDTGPDMRVLKPYRAPAPPFPLELFGPFSEWLQQQAVAKSAPVDYIATGLLTTAAAIIGATRRVLTEGTWSEPSILWLANVGTPSSNKSPALDAVMAPLTRLEAHMARGWDAKSREYEGKKLAAETLRAKWEAAVKAAAHAGTPPPVMPEGAEAPARPTRPRVRIGNATTEAIQIALDGNHRGLLMVRDELSAWIADFDKYRKGGGGGDRGYFLETFGGRSYPVDRVSHGRQLRIPTIIWA